MSEREGGTAREGAAMATTSGRKHAKSTAQDDEIYERLAALLIDKYGKYAEEVARHYSNGTRRSEPETAFTWSIVAGVIRRGKRSQLLRAKRGG